MSVNEMTKINPLLFPHTSHYIVTVTFVVMTAYYYTSANDAPESLMRGSEISL